MKYFTQTIVLFVCLLHVGNANETEKPNVWRILSRLKTKKPDNENSYFDINNLSKPSNNPKNAENIKKVKNLLNKSSLMSYFLDKKKPLEKDVQSRTVRLGFPCINSEDCGPGQGHQCLQNICQCNKHYIKHNETQCLPGVLLGFSCLSHGQCRLRVRNSSCVQGFCRCEAGSLPYRRANCLKGSKLRESCRTHSQCSLVTEGSYCKWIVKNVLGKCQCKPDMPSRGDKCGPPGFALGAPCGKTYDCSKHVPGSICVALENGTSEELSPPKPIRPQPSRTSSLNEVFLHSYKESGELSLGGICRCPDGYLAISNDTRCVPVKKELGVRPISLGKPCLFSSQCEASDPYSACKDGVCECVAPSSVCSAKVTGCRNETFQCFSDGRCISGDFVCDGNLDCTDGSDESLCVSGRCPHHAFTCLDGTCIGRAAVCNGIPDCPDKSDERNCHGDKEGCPKTSFRCSDGQCLPGFEFCNAFVSCNDRSDEHKDTCIGGMLRVPQCPFRCKNGRCRSVSILCSGKDGCGDNSDEEYCSVCNCPKP